MAGELGQLNTILEPFFLADNFTWDTEKFVELVPWLLVELVTGIAVASTANLRYSTKFTGTCVMVGPIFQSVGVMYLLDIAKSIPKSGGKLYGTLRDTKYSEDGCKTIFVKGWKSMKELKPRHCVGVGFQEGFPNSPSRMLFVPTCW